MAREKRYRSMTEQLGSILIAFEVVAVFCAGMALFGLKALPAPVTLGGTALFLLLMAGSIRTLRYGWGKWVVVAIQVALMLMGFVHGSMWFVGGVFLILWLYCMVQGGKIDAARAPIIAEYERARADTETR